MDRIRCCRCSYQDWQQDNREAKQESQLQGETELAPAGVDNRDSAQEVAPEAGSESQAVNEMDWDNYIQDYSSAPSMPSSPKA